MMPSPPNSESRAHGPIRCLAMALAFTVGQIVFACLAGSYADGAIASRPAELARHYCRLVNFDSQWYLWIADHGYDAEREFQKGKTGNVAFFPGLPLLVRGLGDVAGLPTPLALLIVSQLACFGFWSYFFLILDRYAVPPGRAALLGLVVASQPGAFFLVAGYAESLFLFSLLGYVYWTDADRPALKWLGAIHGIVMTATRIVGLPLVVYPVVRALFSDDRRLERLIDALLLAAISSLGGLAFFGYCHSQFGTWDLYFTSQEAGWRVRPDPLALLNPDTYLLDVELWRTDGFLSPDWLSRALVPVGVIAFVVLGGFEWYVSSTQPDTTIGDRIGLYACAVLLFVAMTAGLHGNQYRSVVRYFVGCVALICLELGHLVANEDLEGPDWAFSAAAIGLAVPSAVIQAVYVNRFMHGLWVA